MLRFSLPFCLFARSSGAGIGCGTCGERTGCGGDLFGRASLRFQLGLKAGWCDLTAFFVRGHGDRRDRLYLPAVVTVHGGAAAEGVCRGDAADVDPVPDTNPDLPPLQLMDSAVERGAVSWVDAGRQCTVADPLGVVGGGGGGVLLFVLPFRLVTTSVHIPLGLRSGCGPCGVRAGYGGE